MVATRLRAPSLGARQFECQVQVVQLQVVVGALDDGGGRAAVVHGDVLGERRLVVSGRGLLHVEPLLRVAVQPLL